MCSGTNQQRLEKMTPGIASSRAELSSPLLPPHLFTPRVVSHFGSAVFVSLRFTFIPSNPSFHISFCFLLAQLIFLSFVCILSVSHFLNIHLLPSTFHFFFSHISSSLSSLSFTTLFNPYLLFYNLLLSNYLSSMTDLQKLVL